MAFCTATDIDNVLSATGVDLRVDDGVEATLVAEAIEEADSEIDQATYYLYTAASLASNAWVNHRAKYLAAEALCFRRNNSPSASLALKCKDIRAELERVRTGSLMIPRAVMSKAAAPTMSNIRPALRPHPRGVVETKRSTGTAEGYNQNNRDPWDRLTTEHLDFCI